MGGSEEVKSGGGIEDGEGSILYSLMQVGAVRILTQHSVVCFWDGEWINPPPLLQHSLLA